MSTLVPATIAVPVHGGDLTVGVWNDDCADAPAVLAIHGITASHRCWPLVAERLPGVRVIAPDLRGRGRSNALGEPYGLHQHVLDLVAVLDAVGEDKVAVLAHSMGAFVAVLLAAEFPERVSSLTLVDGGIPLEPSIRSPAHADSGGTAVLGPAAERLSMEFASVDDYREFWREHPAFRGHWSSVVEGYVDYDLRGAAPHWTPSGVIGAVQADVAELYGGEAYEAALGRIAAPTTFLRAPRGLLDEPEALYPVGRAQRAPTIPGLTVVEVDDVNHYTIVLGPDGAETVAHHVRAALSARSDQEFARKDIA